MLRFAIAVLLTLLAFFVTTIGATAGSPSQNMELRCFLPIPAAAAAAVAGTFDWSGLTLNSPLGVQALFPSLCGGGSGGDPSTSAFVTNLTQSIKSSEVEERTDAYVLFLGAQSSASQEKKSIATALSSLVGLKSRDVDGKKNFGKKVEIKLGAPSAASPSAGATVVPDDYMGGIDAWTKIRHRNPDGAKGGVTNVDAVVSWLQEEAASMKATATPAASASASVTPSSVSASTGKLELLEAAILHLNGKESDKKLYVCVLNKKRRQAALPGIDGLGLEETEVRAELKVYQAPTASDEKTDEDRHPGQWALQEDGSGATGRHFYFRTWAVEGAGGGDTLQQVMADWKSSTSKLFDDTSSLSTAVDGAAAGSSVKGPPLAVGSYPGFLSWFFEQQQKAGGSTSSML